MERGESAFPILERLPAHPFASQAFHALPRQAFCQSLAPPVPLAEPLAVPPPEPLAEPLAVRSFRPSSLTLHRADRDIHERRTVRTSEHRGASQPEGHLVDLRHGCDRIRIRHL